MCVSMHGGQCTFPRVVSGQRPAVRGRDQRVGPVERDRSVGESDAGDGNPMTIGGVMQEKGLGTHAAVADVVVYLGGQCTAFSALLGLDDETTQPVRSGSSSPVTGTCCTTAVSCARARGAGDRGRHRRPHAVPTDHRRRRRQELRPRRLGRRPPHLLISMTLST